MESQINILLLDKWKTNFFPFDDKKNVSLLLLLLLLLKWQTEKKLQYGNRFNCNQWQCWCFHHVSSLFRACQRARAREMKKIIHTHNTSCWLLMFFFSRFQSMPSAAPMMNISKAMYGRSFIFLLLLLLFFCSTLYVRLYVGHYIL